MRKLAEQKGARSSSKRMGRPKVLAGPVQVINLHIESSLCDLIDHAVSERGLSGRAEFIREAVKKELGLEARSGPQVKSPEPNAPAMPKFEDLPPEAQAEINERRKGKDVSALLKETMDLVKRRR